VTPGQNLRVLMVEDSESDAALVIRELRRKWPGLEATVTDTPAAMEHELSTVGWDIVLSDYSLPGFGAVAAHGIAARIAPGTPFVVVSGTIGEERAVELMRLGVTDYVLKDHLERLNAVVDRAVREAREHAALDEAQRRLITAAEEWHDTFDAISDGVFLLDTERRVHRHNIAATRIIGLPSEKIVGADVHDLMGALGAASGDPVVATSDLATKRFEIGPCKGDRLWYDVNADVVLSTSKEPAGYVVVMSDITARRRSEEQLRSLVGRLERTIQGAVSIAAHMVEKRDPYTAGHQEAVAEIAADIALRLGMSAEEIDLVHTAAVLHDIGKIAVPAEILVKPGKLDQFEWLLIQRHPEVGAEILEDAELGGPIAEIIREHHERLDGSGYPAGLVGDEICMQARIIAVADTTEAMLAHRPYRPALSLEQTTAELVNGRGRLYDAAAVDACLASIASRPVGRGMLA